MTYSRRNFLKGLAAFSGTTLVGPALLSSCFSAFLREAIRDAMTVITRTPTITPSVLSIPPTITIVMIVTETRKVKLSGEI